MSVPLEGPERPHLEPGQSPNSDGYLNKVLAAKRAKWNRSAEERHRRGETLRRRSFAAFESRLSITRQIGEKYRQRLAIARRGGREAGWSY